MMPPRTYPQHADRRRAPASDTTGNALSALSTSTAPGNVVVLTSPSGGVGLSTFCAMLSWELHKRQLSCALVDGDFTGGGIDLLLGMENEPGVRFGQIDAPLGHLEGLALNDRLPVWEGVGLLAFNSWNSDVPNWWEVRAAIRALSDVNRVVVVDAARGEVLAMVPELTQAITIVLAELSVLGMARAKGYLSVSRAQGRHSSAVERIVGVPPAGSLSGSGVLSVAEASEFLHREVAGPVRRDRKIQADMLQGLGIRRIGDGARRTVADLADHVAELLGSRGAGRGAQDGGRV